MREKERVTNMLAGAQQQLYATEREKQSITQQLLHNQHLLRQMVRIVIITFYALCHLFTRLLQIMVVNTHYFILQVIIINRCPCEIVAIPVTLNLTIEAGNIRQVALRHLMCL